MRPIPMAVALLFACQAVAVAQPVRSLQPPANALPLSEIVAAIEQREDVAYFDEIEWDSDGYWEIEFYRPDGARIELDVDPVSGQAR